MINQNFHQIERFKRKETLLNGNNFLPFAVPLNRFTFHILQVFDETNFASLSVGRWECSSLKELKLKSFVLEIKMKTIQNHWLWTSSFHWEMLFDYSFRNQWIHLNWKCNSKYRFIQSLSWLLSEKLILFLNLSMKSSSISNQQVDLLPFECSWAHSNGFYRYGGQTFDVSKSTYKYIKNQIEEIFRIFYCKRTFLQKKM